MAEHTKGPWKHWFSEENSRTKIGRYYFTGNGGEHESVVISGIRRENREAEANARLIAAAPDLLAACKLATEAMGAHGPCTNNSCSECRRAWGNLRAAIAKATA